MREQIEWAVVYAVFRGMGVMKTGIKSREEAEAWRVALQITEDREAAQSLYERDAHVQPRHFRVVWRRVDSWHPPEEAP